MKGSGAKCAAVAPEAKMCSYVFGSGSYIELRSSFDPRQRQRIFPLASVSRPALGPTQPMGTGGPFPGAKARPGRDADHSPPSSAEVKNEQELYLLSPQTPSRRVAGQL
jgi:hypothetical protein